MNVDSLPPVQLSPPPGASVEPEPPLSLDDFEEAFDIVEVFTFELNVPPERARRSGDDVVVQTLNLLLPPTNADPRWN